MDKKNEAGFTLLELLLAIGISALVLVSAYSGLRIGWMSYRRLDSQIQSYQSLRSGFSRLANDLRNSFLFNRLGNRSVVFSGTQEEMSFTALIKARNKEGVSYVEVAKVFYKLEEKNLLRAYIKGKDILNPDVKPEYEVFLADLTSLAFSYATMEPDRASSLSWENSFTDKTLLPQAVRVKLTQNIKGLPAVTLTKSVLIRDEL